MYKKFVLYDVLHKVQKRLIQLQNKLFASRPQIEESIKTLSRQIVTIHHAAIIMKEKLELAIAMSKMANSTFTRASDHDIACQLSNAVAMHFLRQRLQTLVRFCSLLEYCKQPRQQ